MVASAPLSAVIVQSSIKSEIIAESISFFQDQDGGAAGGRRRLDNGRRVLHQETFTVQKSRLSWTDCILVREASDVHCQVDELDRKSVV